MKKEKKLAKFQIYTDLIIEKKLPDKKNNSFKTINVENLKIISNLENSQNDYFVTIEFEDITDTDNQKNIDKVFVKYLKKLMNKLNINDEDKCLVIGLGNRKSTPDSLGPNVIDNILVTSHLFNIKDFIVDSSYRSVSAVTPNVTSVTGLETYNFIKTLVKSFKPDFLIVIDALVAKSLSRVNKIIQISNTGIQPGSGVGGFQESLTSKSLGIPIISIGVPTIVSAEIIINDTINYLIDESEEYKNLICLEKMNEIEVKSLVNKILYPFNSLMVTPKEIDFVIEKLSKVLSEGINKVLHNKHKNYFLSQKKHIS